MAKINLIGLTAGVVTILLIAVSVYVPWWILSVGKPSIVQVNFSPVNLNFGLLGNSITIPLIWALNLASLLTLLSGGIIMLIYSLKPAKSYSKDLLGYGYKKPLYAVIMFVVGLVVLTVLAKSFTGISVPLNGSTAIQLPSSMVPNDTSISVSVFSAFEWPFYLAIVLAGLCVAARVYHRKLISNIVLPAPMPTATAPATQP